MKVNYKFYKVTTGEFIQRVSIARKDRDIAINAVTKLGKELGASSVSEFSRGGIAFFSFNEKPDQKVWKRSGDGYMPKLSSKIGKRINKKIADLPKIKNIQECLDVFGLYELRVFGEATPRGVRIYSPSFCGKCDKETYFIKVPQSEDNPYIPSSSDMVECKEWEMLKFMDE